MLLLPACGAAGAPLGVGPLLWRDEFTGSSLDNDRWKVLNPGFQWGADDFFNNDPNAVSVAGGVAQITTFSKDSAVHSAVIATRRAFTYGYFEARLRFHDAPGTVSAFWLLPDPPRLDSEIDVAEHRYADGSGSDVSHGYDTALHHAGVASQARDHGPFANLGNDTWNTFALRWSADGYEFFKDGKPVWKTSEMLSGTPTQVLLSTLSGSGQDFQDWAGYVPTGGYGTRQSSTTIFQADYVRVYAAYPADANLDGQVDAADLSALATHYGHPGDFAAGDFNGDGVVDVHDITLLATDFGQGTGGRVSDADLTDVLTAYPQLAADYAALTGVPEPPALLVFLGAAGLLARRKSRKGGR